MSPLQALMVLFGFGQGRSEIAGLLAVRATSSHPVSRLNFIQCWSGLGLNLRQSAMRAWVVCLRWCRGPLTLDAGHAGGSSRRAERSRRAGCFPTRLEQKQKQKQTNGSRWNEPQPFLRLRLRSRRTDGRGASLHNKWYLSTRGSTSEPRAFDRQPRRLCDPLPTTRA